MDSEKTNRGHPSNREHDKQACPMQGLRQHAMKQLIFCESAIQPPQSSTKEIYILCAASRSKTLHFFQERTILFVTGMNEMLGLAVLMLRLFSCGNTIPKVKHLPQQSMTLYLHPGGIKVKKKAFLV